MPEHIQLLPDHLANQIAAGEVIQRPSSAVKELLENAIDAGASQIQLIVKDAGKELIQVVDNGCGMSPIDARMSFERHATSKIRHIDDLFAIKTMGFRGEALASMAAVAQIELKTRREGDELGTELLVEATSVKKQDTVSCPAGTSFAVKNLFYNVPARRKFLKSNNAEYKHILDEFTRIGLAHPEISFRLFHNNNEQLFLPETNLKGRIIDLLGNKAEKNLVSVTEDAGWIKISGYVGKPAAAARQRGNQYYFVNQRFIRSPYLHHAVNSAFEGLIDKDSFPYYVLFLELDPASVDINVHPSKQEVKFDDERTIYAYVHAAVKHALAKFNIAPSLDFTLDPTINNLSAVSLPATSSAQTANQSQSYLHHSFSEHGKAHYIDSHQDRLTWQAQRRKLFPESPVSLPSKTDQIPLTEAAPTDAPGLFDTKKLPQSAFLFWGAYLITTVKSGYLLLHHKRVLERICFEQMEARLTAENTSSQQLLFPIPIEISMPESLMMAQTLPFLKKIGYDIRHFGHRSYVIHGAPADLAESNIQPVLEGVLEEISHNPELLKDPRKDALLRRLAKRMAQPKPIDGEAAQTLIDELFACRQPQYAPDGQTVFRILTATDLETLL